MNPRVLVGLIAAGVSIPIVLFASIAKAQKRAGTLPSLLNVLASSGVKVVAEDQWQTRGRMGFRPEGIMLHHTAGPKEGDAPSLSIIVHGRPGLKGPLANLYISRSGVVHVVAAGTANHGGQGSRIVLNKVRKGEPVKGDAKENGYRDDMTANESFYGIEVENSGLPGDPYPEEQLQALRRVLRALLHAHGWNSNRVIHHRQWTDRKIDMSYRGDVL